MFNKDLFSSLLLKAMGKRTKQEYSIACNVSRPYISKLISMSLDNPPSPGIILKLANGSNHRVTYSDLMHAAGFSDAITLPSHYNEVKNITVRLVKEICKQENIDDSFVKYIDDAFVQYVINDITNLLKYIKSSKSTTSQN